MFQRKYLNFQKIKTTPILLKIQIALKLFKVEGNTQFFMFYFEIQIFKRVSKEILEFFFFFFYILCLEYLNFKKLKQLQFLLQSLF